MSTQASQADSDAANHPPQTILARLAQGWDRFFFSPADPTTLGMIRICCGLITVYTLVAFSLDLQEFFGKQAWYDLELRNEIRHTSPVVDASFNWTSEGKPYTQGTWVWSIWFHVTDPRAMTIVQTIFIVGAVLFTIGLCTRLTSALTWFAMISCIHRSPITVFGVDTMTAIALLYLMIGPSGAALSVDRLIGRWWTTYRTLRRSNSSHESSFRQPALPLSPSVGANFAIRLMQIHVCIIYLAAGLSKLQGPSWWSGTAIWGTIANFEFAPMQYDWYMAFLTFLARHRFWWELFSTAGTVFTLVFEIGFVFLVWSPRTRWVILAMAVTLHGGIGLFMGLKTFSMMMLTLVMAFVPPEQLRRLLAILGRGPNGLRLYFSGQRKSSVRAASLVHALDVWDQIELVEQGSDGKPLGQPALSGGKGAAVAVKEAPAETRTAGVEGVAVRLVTQDGQTRTGAALYGRLLVTLGVFRVFAPWCWVGAFRERKRPASVVRPAPVEPVSLRPSAESVKAAGTHVKQKR